MQRPDKSSNSVNSALWRWPAISLLALVWVGAALVALLTGGVAKGAHAVAEACAVGIQVLRNRDLP